jgi:hypothetical protein
MNYGLAGYQRVPYQTRLYVERPERTLIEEQIVTKEGSRPSQPIINFWGIDGIGKTWLLHHLAEEYQARRKKGTFTCYYEFSDSFSWSLLLQSLVAAVQAQFPEASFPQGTATLEEDEEARAIAEFIKGILDLARNRQLFALFLFDNTEKLAEAEWKRLEAGLIEPLAASGQAIFALAGRRPVPKWYRFEARRRVMEAEKTEVTPFTETQVRIQVEKGNYALPAELLIANAAGNPLLVDALARQVAEKDKPERRIARILEAYEEQLLQEIPEELRSVLYLLSAMRFYRVEALRFLAESRPKQALLIEGNYLRLLRRLENETEVVRWSGERRAWVTDGVVRRLINRRQFLANQRQFKKQHKQAQALYWKWAEAYPTTSEDFILEIWFHLANIYQADGNAERLQAGVYEALQFALKHMSGSEDRLVVLHRQFQHDQELQELLPAELRDSLAHDLEPERLHKTAA